MPRRKGPLNVLQGDHESYLVMRGPIHVVVEQVDCGQAPQNGDDIS